jgi:hypothetical protein
MYPHAFPLWTDKPLWLDGLSLLVDKDYVSLSGAPKSQHWGLDETGPSTGWETTEDTATVIAIHPDAHLVCDNAEIADIRRKTFQRSDNQGWTQKGHPNMIIRTTPPKNPNTSTPTNPFNVLAQHHD